ncbi:MAG: hypothetical protein BGO68_05310 [Candidatus Amoebophilus sp. 36-38]|nr:MAG: hypothetical protein BGO68_05310 [Candidatus Amoebophilus sp. 36-38]
MPTLTLLVLNILLFVIGLFIVLTKRNIVFVVIGVELILQAAISNCIVFDSQYSNQLQGQILIIFSMAISICEIVLLITLALRLYQQYKTTDLDVLS